MSWLTYLSRPDTLVFLIPIVAIVIGGVIAIMKAVFRHRERMAMIERGMNPDCPADASQRTDEHDPGSMG